MSYARLIAFVVAAVGLVSCGGGGGGAGQATIPTPTTNPPVVVTPPPPPVVNPPVVINPPPPIEPPPMVVDPPVTIPSGPDYALGTTDDYYMDGGGFGGDVTQSTRLHFPEGVTLFHRRIEGPDDGDPSISVPLPPLDIRQAWRAGWTGRGTNILIMDSFGIEGRTPTGDQATHGYTVTLSAIEIADRANYFGVNAGLRGSGVRYFEGGLRARDNTRADENTSFDVINMSFGTDPLRRNPTQTELNREYQFDYFNDVLGGSLSRLPNAADAVLTKAAGNESADAGRVVDNVALVTHNGTRDRTLIVGALNRYAQQGGAGIASYSNYAGFNASTQNRFLIEYGGSPYGENAFLCNADIAASVGCRNAQELGDTSSIGTSYAAPRVAGHAALVRDKFPNLTGADTASILLDTATYEGLSCHPGCSVSTYGQGRVDVGRALAPVGAMR